MASIGQPAAKHAHLIQARKGLEFTRPELNWCMVAGATCSNLFGGLCFVHWFSPPPQRGHWHRGKLHREAVRGPMSVATWAEYLDGYAPIMPPNCHHPARSSSNERWWKSALLYKVTDAFMESKHVWVLVRRNISAFHLGVPASLQFGK